MAGPKPGESDEKYRARLRGEAARNARKLKKQKERSRRAAKWNNPDKPRSETFRGKLW